MLHITITRWIFSCLLLFTSAAYARTTLDFITAVDRERDHLRRQLKDPEEFIKPLSLDISFYIAGQKKLNYERKLTPQERQAALKSILRTAIIHARFKEAAFTEYFGEIKSGQRDLYYSHAAHVNVAYCAAQCLVEAQAPLDLEALVKRVVSQKGKLDIFKKEPLLQDRFTAESIARFLGEAFIRWYTELSLGFPDITNQFVFDERFARILKQAKDVKAFHMEHTHSSTNYVSDDPDFPCYVYTHAYTESLDELERIYRRNLGFCYELSEIMGLHGLVCPAYLLNQNHPLQFTLTQTPMPDRLHSHSWLTEIMEAYARTPLNDDTIRVDDVFKLREQENPALKIHLTTPTNLSRILTFWFLTQQTTLRSKQWISVSPDEFMVSDVREGMGSACVERAAAPFPFGTRKLRNEDFGYYETFGDIRFSPELMRRIQRFKTQDFAYVFKKHHVTKTEEKEFYDRLSLFQEALERFKEKPIHELFLHLWDRSIFRHHYRFAEPIENCKPIETAQEARRRILKEKEAQERKSTEPGSFKPAKCGVGQVMYSRPSVVKKKTVSSIDEAERVRRRNLAYEAALKRMKESANSLGDF